MSAELTSAILASIVSGTVAIAILLRRPRRRLYGTFSAFTFVLLLWHGAGIAYSLGVELRPVKMAAALLIPPPAILFFRELLRDRSYQAKGITRVSYVLSFVLLLAVFSPWRDTLLVRALVTLYVLGVMAWVVAALFKQTRRARTESERKSLGYLFLGGLGALILSAGELVPGAGLGPALGRVASTGYIYFLYQSIVARRLIDLDELLGKAAVLGVLTLVLATVYALLVLWVGTHQQSLWLFNTLVASFVILILYDQVRPRVEEATHKLLFRERYELHQAIQRLLRSLRTTLGLEEMSALVLDGLHATGRAENIALYLPSDGQSSFYLFDYRGAEPPSIFSISRQRVLLLELRRERRPILLEHLVHRRQVLPPVLTHADPTLQRELERATEAIETMRAMGANAIIPIVSGERLSGIVTLGLGSEYSVEAYTTRELAALLSLAEACAVTIENSQEYEKRRQRDRLVALGEMAAGMAHEIRNPLGAIKGAAQCLDPSTLPADAQEFIGVIVEEVDRLNGVVRQFLEYARPLRSNPVPVQVNDVVSATLRLLGADAVPPNIAIEQSLTHDLPQASADPEQLKQVLINLVLNAIQAMPHGGKLTLATGQFPGPPAAAEERNPPGTPDFVFVRVTDTGEGIRPDDLPRIFVPFFTTKERGTGLGLAISQRIVENLGGRIEVASRPNEGTTFTVRLPTSARPAAAEPTSAEDQTGEQSILH